MTVLHAMSVDVEDWFQVLNMAHLIDRAEWDGFELRCADSTRRLLDLFAKRDAKATFFCLGWIAERIPEVVREIHDAGHEVGSHGYDHRLLPDLGQQGFREDLARTADILSGITGERPKAFRACTLPRERWTHAAHWAGALCLLSEDDGKHRRLPHAVLTDDTYARSPRKVEREILQDCLVVLPESQADVLDVHHLRAEP